MPAGRTFVAAVVIIAAAPAVSACTAPGSVASSPVASSPVASSPVASSPATNSPVAGPTRTTPPAASPAAPVTRTRATPASCTVSHQTWKGHRRFYSDDRHCYTSPWFDGRHRIMIGFGCTSSPWYPIAPTCPGRQGIHHGIDVDLPLGTAVHAGVSGTAEVRPASMGPAYGRNGLIIRAAGHDFVLGHLAALLVHDGQTVRAGQLIARSGMSGVEDEDGPHLHLEVRPAGGGYRAAIDPWPFLRLTRAG